MSHLFKKGVSGNAKGRPKGVPLRSTVLRKELEAHGDAMVKVAIEHAEGGDMSALRLVLERLVPPIKSISEPIKFDLIGSTITEKAESVLQACADGVLDADTAKTLISAIADVGKIAESDELMRRVEALEGGV